MSTLKTATSALTAAVLVTGIGLAWAQTEDQSQTTNSTVVAATPSEQTPADPNAAPLVDNSAAMPQQQSAATAPPPVDSTTPAPQSSDANSQAPLTTNTSPSTNSSSNTSSVDNSTSSTTATTSASPSPSYEPAARADRN